MKILPLLTTIYQLPSVKLPAVKFRAVILPLFLLLVALPVAAKRDLRFEGLQLPSIPLFPQGAASGGLEEVYVLQHTQGVRAVFTAQSASASVIWYRFDKSGTALSEIPFSRNGKETSVTLPAGDCGIYIEEDGRIFSYWIVDYSLSPCNLQGLSPADEQDCDRMALVVSGEAAPIYFHNYLGRSFVVDRELSVSYSTLMFNEENPGYDQIATEQSFTDVPESKILRVYAPLCATEFVLSGDRFLRSWNMEQEVVCPTVEPNAIAAETTATEDKRDYDNEQKQEAALGGSGPVDVTFMAYYTDAVTYKEWQFSRDPQFEEIDLRIQEDEVNRTFNDQGTTYVRFVASNADASCNYTGQTYEVFVGESKLLCPNAFSPDASPGVNDEWKVSYKSIIEFDCHIFNRWGVEVAHLTHPSQGWDGKYKGKYVPSGVYFYVIKARGAEGRNYNLKGDINILKQKQSITSSETETVE